jgi:hypothetical protein
LRGFEWARSEEVLASRDQRPDEHRGVLALAIIGQGAELDKRRRKFPDQRIPRVDAEYPLLECLAPAPVVNEWLT